MAFGMKGWMAATLGGMAVTAVLLLPPGTIQDAIPSALRPRPRQIKPAGERLVRLRAERRRLTDRLLRLRASGATRELLEREGEPGTFGVYASESHGELLAELNRKSDDQTSSMLEQYREEARDVVGGAPPASGDGPIVAYVALHPDDLLPSADLANEGGGGHSYLSGTLDDGTPYCALVATRRPERDFSRLIFYAGTGSYFRQSPLRYCHFWAKYGTPGGEIDAWYAAGGWAHGERRAYRPDIYAPTGLPSWADRRFDVEEYEWASGCESPDESCAGRFTDTLGMQLAWRSAVRRPSEAHTFYQDLRRVTDLAYAANLAVPRPAQTLLFDLERRFGEEAFLRFWTSELDVEPAFEAAFGIPLEEWMHQWTVSTFGELDGGPAVPLKDLGLSLLTLAALMGMGVFTHRHRQAG